MALELVTGYQGKDHVTAEQWADFNRGIFGDAAILPIGNRMETAIQTANQITVKDGVAVFDGRQVYIGYGESENIIIESGTQGMLRRDIVVLEYNREEVTGVESVEFKVITGTPASADAKDPSVQNTDIRTGVFVSQKPFCRIRLNGTAIEGVDALVQVKELKPHAFASPVNNLAGTDPELALSGPMGAELYRMVTELNGNMDIVKSTFLKRHSYQSTSGKWSTFNAILPEKLSNYGYIPFLIIFGGYVNVVNVVGSSVGTTISDTGIYTNVLLGNKLNCVAIKENGKIRVKFSSGTSTDVPVSIIMLREGTYIENGNFSS